MEYNKCKSICLFIVNDAFAELLFFCICSPSVTVLLRMILSFTRTRMVLLIGLSVAERPVVCKPLNLVVWAKVKNA